MSRTARAIPTRSKQNLSLPDSEVHRTYRGKIVDECYSPTGMAVRLRLVEAEHSVVAMPARDAVIALSSASAPSAHQP